MSSERNDTCDNRSIEEILLTSDDETSDTFIDVEFKSPCLNNNNTKFTSPNPSSPLASNLEQSDASKNSILMLNDSSLKKTPTTPNLNSIAQESDTDSFHTPDILQKSINSKKTDADEDIEFCYVNSESDTDNDEMNTSTSNPARLVETLQPEDIFDENTRSNLSYESCQKALSSKFIPLKKIDSNTNKNTVYRSSGKNIKLPIGDSFQTLDLNETDTDDKYIDVESTSTPQFNSQSINSLRSSFAMPSLNDPKLKMDCFVSLKKMDENAIKFYRFDKFKPRAKKKKKIHIAYKSFNSNLSEPESANSNSSAEWNSLINKKRKTKPKSTLDATPRSNNSLNVSKSSSNLSIRNKNQINYPSPSVSLNESDSKKNKRSHAENDFESVKQKRAKNNNDIFLSENLAAILNEDTNMDFNNDETFEVSHVQDGKLKIKKRSKTLNKDENNNSISIDSELTRESSNFNDNSNVTIVLSSSRSCSPMPYNNEPDELIRKPKKRVIDDDFDSESSSSNQSNQFDEKRPDKPVLKIVKKSENLLKSTLKKSTTIETVLIQKQTSLLNKTKSQELESEAKDVENANAKHHDEKIAKKIVKKAINQSNKSPLKIQKSKESKKVVDSLNLERPKPFKIPKLNRPDDKTDGLVIKPNVKNQLKENITTTSEGDLTKKQNEIKSVKKDSKNIKKKVKNTTKITKVKQVTSTTNSEITQLISSIPDNQNKKLVNKSNKVLEKIKSKYIPTLSDLNQKRIAFNKSIGANYPYFSLLYLMDEYVKKMSTVACLDFNLLISYLPPNEDPELSVATLDQNKQIQLCKLISRSAGKINVYKLFGLDCLLREYPKKYEPIAHDYPKPVNDDDHFFSILNSLSLSQAVIVYKRFISQLNTPFRTVEMARIANTNYDTLIIKFENDFQVDSYDLSIESVVFSALHKENKKFKIINNVLHQNYVAEQDYDQVSNFNSINKNLVITPDSYDHIRKQVKDDQLLDKMFTKTCFEKVVRLRMPENFFMTCQTQVNKKPYLNNESNFEKKERFLNHITSTRSDRGKMRIAEKHKIISDHEFNYRLKRLENEHDIQVDLSNLFKETTN